MKKTLYLLPVLLCWSFLTFAQDDLLNMLDNAGPAKPEPVTATFKTTRVLNGHSIEQVAKNHLDFRINHRFGTLNSGIDEFWGLDYARIRLGLEYGINDWCMVGIGRNNLGRKAWDYFGKLRLLRQTKTNSMPISLSYHTSAAVDVLKITNSKKLVDRLTYTHQLLLARKITDGISIQLSPTFIHRNQVETPNLDNDLFALGIGGRFKITRRTSFNVEYFHLFNPKKVSNEKLVNCLSVGFDIETGGHVFQLHFTNSLGLIEKDFIANTSNRWDKGDISYGFNISRTFSFK
jgi:hypothetical protein